jgi:hypothetical protein
MNKNLMIKAAPIALIAALIAPAALAGNKHRVVRQAPRLDVLAYELREASRDVRAEAIFRARNHRAHRGPGRIDGRLIESLTGLERQADRFLLAVDRRHARRVEQEYVRLVRAFERASRQVVGTRSPHVRREFRDVAFLMQRVTRRVELAAGYGPGHPGYDRRRDAVHGTVVLGDVIGDARFRIRVDW